MDGEGGEGGEGERKEDGRNEGRNAWRKENERKRKE